MSELKLKIRWEPRYSDTDKPDRLNRWARVGHLEHKSKDPFKSCQIAWICRTDNTYHAYVYLGRGEFKKGFMSLKQAKSYCEKIVTNFYEEYLS